MNDTIYHRLRERLDAIPNGFPATKSGVEIKILKKIFTDEEAGVFMKLKISFETAAKISARTGLREDYLKAILSVMDEKGQIFAITIGGETYYRLMPFVFGIYEFQLSRIDRELSELFEAYSHEAFGGEFFSHTPALMKVLPINVEVPHDVVIEPYESAIQLINGAKSWAVHDCICKKEKALLGHRCDKPMEVCLAFAPMEHVFDNSRSGRAITRDEAIAILNIAEEAGLVHMTSNTKRGHFYICNCCKCCCGPLLGYNLTSKHAVAKSNYVAVVDSGLCTACGICADRCQAGAVTIGESAKIDNCIGCGLCASTCPEEAIKIVRRDVSDTTPVPNDEMEWLEERARSRGIGRDYRQFID